MTLNLVWLWIYYVCNIIIRLLQVILELKNPLPGPLQYLAQLIKWIILYRSCRVNVILLLNRNSQIQFYLNSNPFHRVCMYFLNFIFVFCFTGAHIVCIFYKIMIQTHVNKHLWPKSNHVTPFMKFEIPNKDMRIFRVKIRRIDHNIVGNIFSAHFTCFGVRGWLYKMPVTQSIHFLCLDIRGSGKWRKIICMQSIFVIEFFLLLGKFYLQNSYAENTETIVTLSKFCLID